MKDGIHGYGIVPDELTITRLLRELREKQLANKDSKAQIFEITEDFKLGKEMEI